MARICFTLDKNLDEIITRESTQDGKSKSAWCASAIEAYLRLRDHKPDPEAQQLMISIATLEERVRGQSIALEDMRARATHAEGLVASLMAERQALIPERTGGFWSRLFGSKPK